VDKILTEAIPASPQPQGHPGAYLPGLVPGAAAGQYGAPLSVPGGPVVVFGALAASGRCPTCGQFAGPDHTHGVITGTTITGRASGD
jgi:hypothetical protein